MPLGNKFIHLISSKMKKTINIISFLMIVIMINSCDNEQELLKKARAYDSLGETDSAIVYLKEYLVRKPDDLEIRLELVNLYKKVKEYEKAKIICNKTIMNGELSDNSVLKFCNVYKSVLFDEYYILKNSFEDAIKSANIPLAKKLSEDISNCVNSLPSFNYELFKKRDSTFHKKISRINPLTFDNDRTIYKNAIILAFISKKLFVDDTYDLDDFILGIVPLSSINPPDELTMKENDTGGLSIYEITQKEVFLSIAKNASEFGDYFFEHKKWNYASKSFGLSKTFYKKYTGEGWSYAAIASAYNEGISYKNAGQYKLAFEKFDELLSELPNVDDIMEKEHRKTYELLKEDNPTFQKLKPISKIIVELKKLLK